jgi:hypothetical protein
LAFFLTLKFKFNSYIEKMAVLEKWHNF